MKTRTVHLHFGDTPTSSFRFVLNQYNYNEAVYEKIKFEYRGGTLTVSDPNAVSESGELLPPLFQKDYRVDEAFRDLPFIPGPLRDVVCAITKHVPASVPNFQKSGDYPDTPTNLFSYATWLGSSQFLLYRIIENKWWAFIVEFENLNFENYQWKSIRAYGPFEDLSNRRIRDTSPEDYKLTYRRLPRLRGY